MCVHPKFSSHDFICVLQRRASFGMSDKNLLSPKIIEFFFLLSTNLKFIDFHTRKRGTWVVWGNRFSWRFRNASGLPRYQRLQQASITHKLIISYWCFPFMVPSDWKRLKSVIVGCKKNRRPEKQAWAFLLRVYQKRGGLKHQS